MRLLAAFLVGLLTCAPALAADGNAERGEEIYTRCMACHALAQNRVGPRHCGLFGRKAGSGGGYESSDAMKTSGIVWDDKTLADYLKDPKGKVPGTKMVYVGLKQEAQQQDMIAFLKKATQ